MSETSVTADENGREEAVERAKKAATSAVMCEWRSDDYSTESLAHVAVDAALDVLSDAGLLATEQEQFAIRWHNPITGLPNISTPDFDRAQTEKNLAESAFGGAVVSRRVTAWTVVAK